MSESAELDEDDISNDILFEDNAIAVQATREAHTVPKIADESELRRFLLNELQLQEPPASTVEKRSYVPIASNLLSIPHLEDQLALRIRIRGEVVAEPSFELHLYRPTDPKAESIEEIYGFRACGLLKMAQFEECDRYLRSVESAYDPGKPSLLLLHDFFQHPLQLIGVCTRLSTNFNVYMPFLFDIYKIGSHILYQALHDNFPGYVLAYCRDVVPSSFVIVAHGAACYLAQVALNRLPACRRAWMCNNVCQIQAKTESKLSPNVEPAKPPPEISYITDTSCAAELGGAGDQMTTSNIWPSDSESGEIGRTEREPQEPRYAVKQLHSKTPIKKEATKSVASLHSRSALENLINTVRSADEVCRQLTSDCFITCNNKKVSKIELFKPHFAADKFRPLAHFYNRLPRLLFLCPARYQHKFALVPFTKEFAQFSLAYLNLSLAVSLTVDQEKTVVCYFSDHPALPVVPVDGYQSRLLLCTSFDLFGCCEALFGRVII